MQKSFILFIFSFIFSTGKAQKITITDIPVDSNYSFRGLSVVDNKVAWLGGSNGRVGMSIDGGKNWTFTVVPGFEKADFRTIYGFDKNTAIIANAGSPACILRTTDGGAHWGQMYKNDHAAAFIDGVDFWDKKNGVIYGDPINDKLLLLSTTDGGLTWNEFPDSSRVVLEKGEASFAASGTGIRCFGKTNLVITTGGKVSRILFSSNKGTTWKKIKSPMIQGQSSQGIFSIAFITTNLMITVGGDFLNERNCIDHVYYTVNGGFEWKKPRLTTGGYRECVEFIGPKTLMAVGPTGSDITVNEGEYWSPVPNSAKFHVVRKARKGKLIIAAGNGRIAIISN